MRKRWLINAGLLLACLILWLLALRQPAPPATLAERVGLVPEGISSVRLQQGDTQALQFTAVAGGWMLTAPLRGAVGTNMSARLTALVRAPTRLAFALGQFAGAGERDALLADLGLADPWLTLEFDQVRLSVGGAEPIERHRYLLAGEQVLLIDDRWLLPLLAAPEDFLAHDRTAGED